MTAYGPLCVKLFGAKNISASLKISFADSLVFSRLFFGTEIWCDEVTNKSICVLNTMYMRVLRRICDECRYGQNASMSDVEVRRKIGCRSITCKLRIRRLLYLSRLAKHGPRPLMCILAAKDKDGKSMPWINTVMNDMRVLQQFHWSRLSSLGDPCDNASGWWYVKKDFPSEWSELCKTMFSHDDPFDCHDGLGSEIQNLDSASPPANTCQVCNRSFKSVRALATHTIHVHKQTSEAAKRIGNVSECPICRVDFRERVRLIQHLHRREPACCQVFASSFQFFDVHDEAVQCNIDACSQYRSAKKFGHSRPIAGRPPTKVTEAKRFSNIAEFVRKHNLSHVLSTIVVKVRNKKRFLRSLPLPNAVVAKPPRKRLRGKQPDG